MIQLILVIYIVVPGAAWEAHIPMIEKSSCLFTALTFSSFPNTEKISMAGYCE